MLILAMKNNSFKIIKIMYLPVFIKMKLKTKLICKLKRSCFTLIMFSRYHLDNLIEKILSF